MTVQLELDVLGPRGRMRDGVFVLCTREDPQCIDAIHEGACACEAWDPAALTLGAVLAFTGQASALHARVRQHLFALWFEGEGVGPSNVRREPFDDWRARLTTSEIADLLGKSSMLGTTPALTTHPDG